MRILAFILGAALSCSATLAQEHANSAKGPKTRAVTLVSGSPSPSFDKEPASSEILGPGSSIYLRFQSR